MYFESTQKTAERLNVSVRAVQKWAKEGRIPGAKKIGRDWMIPSEFEKLTKNSELYTSHNKATFSLLNADYELGKAKEVAEKLEDKEERDIVLSEFYYYSGQNEKATQIAETYLDNENANVRYLAALICLFANLSLGQMNMAKFALEIIRSDLYDELNVDTTDETKAVGVFVASTASVLLHLPMEGKPLLSKYMIYLPDGLKMFSSYILAEKAYLEQNYEASYAIAKTALNIFGEKYPLPAVFLYLISAISLMNLMQIEKAEKCVLKAYELAKKDGYIGIFGQHHAVMSGLNERIFKKMDPEVYAQIIDSAKAFGKGWISIHNEEAKRNVTMSLSSLEFTIAMLYNRNWRVKEIAHHLDISERTIKNYLSIIYEKLEITSRKELRQYMVQ